MTVDSIIAEVSRETERSYARENFSKIVLNLIEASGAKDVLEIGGGRYPLFTQEQISSLGVNYTSNDISARELSKAPEWVGKAHFDIQTPNREEIAPFLQSFDFAYSKFVMEHVLSYRRAYQNIHAILRPGGVAIAYHPVLYAVPFVLNYVAPERASRSLLQKVFPHRNDDGIPKFPAHYSGCRISKKVREDIKAMGFSDVWQIPFYGHGYYAKFPLVRDVHRVVTKAAAHSGITALAAFAFTIVRK